MQTMMKRLITGVVLAALFLISFFYLPPYVFSVLLYSILLEILIFEWPKLLDRHSVFFWLWALYPMLPFFMLIAMNDNPDYRMLLFILFILVAMHDIGSYCAGITIGRHKIAPRISPAKTWEGFLGGCVLTLLSMLGLGWYFSMSISFIFIMFFILLVCIISFSGDLFESWLKRRAQIKDSGALLPGHGGFLDRFDGILFVAYFFYLFKDHLVVLLNLK